MIRKILCRGIFVLLSVCGRLSWAEESPALGSASSPGGAESALEVVVTANRVETPLDEVASSITILKREDLEQKQQQSVLQALQGVASVDVVQSGGPGGNAAVFMRGANPDHTLVLIDGVEANNPINPSRAFNFADLTLDNIERIEILRGPQSTLYGSDALGGVVNIITRKGDPDGQGIVSVEAGSYGSFLERAALSGASGRFDYAFGLSREDVQGISAASQRYGNTETDGYDNTSFSSRLGAELSAQLQSQIIMRFSDAKSELDNFGGAQGDDPNRVAYDRQFFGRAELNASWLDTRVRQTLGFSYADQVYKDLNDPDIAHPGEIMRSRYEGRSHKVDLQNSFTVCSATTIVGGLETQVESGESQYFSDGMFGPFEDNFNGRTATTNAYYAQLQTEFFDRLYPTAGLRLDQHSKFGSEVTWRVGPALLFRESGTKLSSTVGTGFKAPSLFQLYSSYGNPDLEPEKSVGVDAGIEQILADGELTLGATYFHNDFDNLITFEPNTFKFMNTTKATTQGLEAFIRYVLSEAWSSALTYTYADSEDKELKESLLRRPRHKAAFDVVHHWGDQANAGVSVVFVGSRFDNNYSSYPVTRTSLGSYVLVNLNGSLKIAESVSLFARIENIFDREYEQVYGYGTPGAGVYGGIKVEL